jgi:PAS domain S-box-containing protein
MTISPTPIDIDRMQALADSMRLLIIEVTPDGTIIEQIASSEIEVFVSREQAIGMNLQAVLTPELYQIAKKAIEKVNQTGIKETIVYSIPTTPIKYFSAQINTIGNNRNRLLFTIQEVTEEHKNELLAQQEEAKYRKLLQHSLDIITVLDKEGNVMFDSFSNLTHFGYPEPITGTNIFSITHPDDFEKDLANFKIALNTQGIYGPYELRVKSASGEWRILECLGNNLFNEPLINGYVINSRDITERRKMEESLRAMNDRLNAIIESTNEAIFAVDKDYNYIAYNQRYHKWVLDLYGVDIKIGDHFFLYDVRAADIETAEMSKEFARAMQGEQFVLKHDMSRLTLDGLCFSISFNPIKDGNGNITGIAVFSSNITKQEQAKRMLEQAKNEALIAAQAKSDFLSNMSHEIRTPINAIMGMTDLLIEKIKDKEELEYLQAIKYSSDNLLVVINDVLDFSKIEAGKVRFERIDFNIHERLAYINKIYGLRARQKQLEFLHTLAPDVPLFIKGDPYRMNQILLNLIGNAIKFTKEGKVGLDVKIANTSSDFMFIRFEVWDTGIGIPEEKLESIFESFTQAYTDTTRKFGGTGLGLAITQRLVLLQGGTIEVDSKIGVGTRFKITMPFEYSSTLRDKEIMPEQNVLHNISHLKILVAEDNELNQILIQKILERWNVQFDIVPNGKIALEYLEKHHYHVVLMDLQMPELSGLDVAKIIRSKESNVRNPGVPIIAITADAFPETNIAVLDAGMNDFITKPFQKEELYHKIVRLCL